jgi:hypothetical protein
VTFVRVADFASIALLVFSLVAFLLGLLALGDRNDLHALYWLVVGGLSLRAATNVLRPRGGTR